MHADHPDRAWLSSVSRSIDRWLERPAQTPTSQLTGGGAIAYCEQRLSGLHEDRPVVLMPSATYALWVGLQALGVRTGDEVLLPQYDWVSSIAVVRALGAVPVVTPVAPATLTIDPDAAAALRTDRTRAVVATHLFGVPADVGALRDALPGVSIVEDCAQALGSTLDDRPVGSLGDIAVLSFGPGKRMDTGELGALVARDPTLHRDVLARSAHPIRIRLAGMVEDPAPGLSIRPHPLSAVLLAGALDEDDAPALIAERARLAAYLTDVGIPLLGADRRRGVAARSIPIGIADGTPFAPPPGIRARTVDVHDIAAAARGSHAMRAVVVVDDDPRLASVASKGGGSCTHRR